MREKTIGGLPVEKLSKKDLFLAKRDFKLPNFERVDYFSLGEIYSTSVKLLGTNDFVAYPKLTERGLMFESYNFATKQVEQQELLFEDMNFDIDE